MNNNALKGGLKKIIANIDVSDDIENGPNHIGL